jgi:hypothetical protein
MILLSQLRSPAVSLDWHEAIAVAAALTDLVWEQRLTGVPPLDDVGLLGDGRLQITGSGPGEAPIVAALTARLAALIDARPCPSELRLFVTERRDGAEPDSISRFAESLAFFERPDRRDTLRALALRAAPALERARVADELERLTERARQQAPELPVVPPGRDPVRRPSDLAHQYALPVVVPAVVFLAMAVAAATWFSVPRDEPPPAPASASDAPEKPEGGPATPAAAETIDREAEATAVPVEEATRPVPAAPAAPARASTPRPAGGPAGSGVDVRVTELGGAAIAPPAPPPVPEPARPIRRSSSRIYVAGDPGVTPARLVRPHLPAEPPADVPPEQVGTLELIVNERGTVDHVVLVSPSNRYQERMLVAAAKAWLFEPATRQGQPVRFRARIRVTL